MNTIISLDKDKVHLICVPTLPREEHEIFCENLARVGKEFEMRFILLPIELHSVLSKEMTDEEFNELKEAIKPKKSINDMLHTPLN